MNGRVYRKHQVPGTKTPQSAPGGQVLGPTRYEIGGKVRLVTFSQKNQFSQTTHNKHFTKSLPSLPKAPGTKTPQKSAPGGQVLGPTRYEIGGKVRLGHFFPKIPI